MRIDSKELIEALEKRRGFADGMTGAFADGYRQGIKTAIEAVETAALIEEEREKFQKEIAKEA